MRKPLYSNLIREGYPLLVDPALALTCGIVKPNKWDLYS